MTAQHLRDLETTRRYATLLAVLLEAKATLIDQALDLHDRMIGALFNRAKRSHAEEFQQSGEAIHEKGLIAMAMSRPAFTLHGLVNYQRRQRRRCDGREEEPQKQKDFLTQLPRRNSLI